MRNAYTIAHYLAVPYLLLRLAWRGRRNPAYWLRWGERFGFGPPLPRSDTVWWIHAVSVGEAQAAVPLVRALQERHPDVSIVMTTTTLTGAQRVEQVFGSTVTHRYFPYDLPGAMARFLGRMRPALLVVMETELWPNLLDACARRSIPVVLANVRLSERSAAGYRRVPALTAAMLRAVAAVAVQSAEDAARLEELGADRDRMTVTGSVKFDVRLPASLREEAAVLRRVLGVDRSVWVAASTHEGEESQVLDCFEAVRERHAGALLLLVPRHPERFAAAAAAARRRGFATASRTQQPASCSDVQVFIGDTMGELPVFYAAADVAFVGGSLVEIGGHNMLEPAALGVPVLFGPYVFNFAEISRRLIEEGAARQVHDAPALAAAVVEYLGNANLRHNTGEKGRAFVERNRGAMDSVVAIIEAVAAEAAPVHGAARTV